MYNETLGLVYTTVRLLFMRISTTNEYAILKYDPQ